MTFPITSVTSLIEQFRDRCDDRYMVQVGIKNRFNTICEVKRICNDLDSARLPDISFNKQQKIFCLQKIEMLILCLKTRDKFRNR